jgi:oligopeptide/dipeptide ABC transporter ATP-binding protein
LNQEEILRVEELKAHFFTQEGVVKAVDGATFSVKEGKVLGVVGESGCGKSVTAQCIMRIIPNPGKIVGGKILYRPDTASEDPIDLTTMDAHGREIRKIRGGEIAMVFQEPMTSLDPVYTIGNHLLEAIKLHQHVDTEEARQRAIEMLTSVKMPQPERTIDAYPHQLSGGMRQRAMIAIGLSCHPRLLIADEPTTALDVTTEAQILELMRELQHKLGSSIMYITHDLGVIAEMSDEVIVMYLGKVVEKASVDAVFHDPQHPYTRALLQSIPSIIGTQKKRLQAIKGIVPDPFAIPQGCPFWPRCSEFMSGTCNVQVPEYITVEPGHQVRCHLYG